MATLNLPKSELIARLEARKVAIEAEYDDATKSVNEELDRRSKAISDNEAQADWYQSLADGLRDGTFVLSDGGKLIAARRGDVVPPKPGTKASSVATMRGIRGGAPQFQHYSNEDLERRRDSWPAMLADELKPIDNAIDLLNLATDDVVEVNSDDYSGLLNGRTDARYYRHFF